MRCLLGLLTASQLLMTAFVRGDKDDPEYCQRGFQIAGKYHECWEQATYANKYPDLYEPIDTYTGKFVEDYATHMCSVVKPEALQCLRQELEECSNQEKLVQIADESGGACERDHLNPFFKLHILDHLMPVPRDSPCFSIADKSYDCYVKAGEAVVESGANMVDISRFHKVADKFFDLIWDCQIKEFKSNVDVCEHWQIPMLLALQKMAMPSLFGMKLTNHQVAKLELQNGVPKPRPTTEPQMDDDEGRFFILLKVLPDRPPDDEGDVLLLVDTHHGDQPELSVARGNVHDGQDVSDFIGQIVNTEADMTLQEVRKQLKEHRQKYKELKEKAKKLKKQEIEKEKQDKKDGKDKDETQKKEVSVDKMIN